MEGTEGRAARSGGVEGGRKEGAERWRDEGNLPLFSFLEV